MAQTIKKTFIQIFKSSSTIEQEEMQVEFSGSCTTSFGAVKAWGYGYRTPKPRAQEKIAKYLKSTPEILFPKP